MLKAYGTWNQISVVGTDSKKGGWKEFFLVVYRYLFYNSISEIVHGTIFNHFCPRYINKFVITLVF